MLETVKYKASVHWITQNTLLLLRVTTYVMEQISKPTYELQNIIFVEKIIQKQLYKKYDGTSCEPHFFTLPQFLGALASVHSKHVRAS